MRLLMTRMLELGMVTDTNKQLSLELKKARKRRNIKKKEIANFVDIDIDDYSKYEKGDKIPNDLVRLFAYYINDNRLYMVSILHLMDQIRELTPELQFFGQ